MADELEPEVLEVVEPTPPAPPPPPVFQVFAPVSEDSAEVAMMSQHDTIEEARLACTDNAFIECRDSFGAARVY